jgi:hypothetical protein
MCVCDLLFAALCEIFRRRKGEEAADFFPRCFNTICSARHDQFLVCTLGYIRECQFRYLPAFARAQEFYSQMLPASVRIAASEHPVPHFALSPFYLLYSPCSRDAGEMRCSSLNKTFCAPLRPPTAPIPTAETIWKMLRFVDQNKWGITPIELLDFASVEQAGEKERALAGNFLFPKYKSRGRR